MDIEKPAQQWKMETDVNGILIMSTMENDLLFFLKNFIFIKGFSKKEIVITLKNI